MCPIRTLECMQLRWHQLSVGKKQNAWLVTKNQCHCSCTYSGVPWGPSTTYDLAIFLVFSTGTSSFVSKIRRCHSLPHVRRLWKCFTFDRFIQSKNNNIVERRYCSPCCLVFLHIIAFAPGNWGRPDFKSQSVSGIDELSNGSAHRGSNWELHSQHFIPRPEKYIETIIFFQPWEKYE